MSEHYQQLPTPSDWSAMESNSRQNQQHSTTGTSPPQQPQTPETTRRLLFQPMKNSRSSVEGTSPPKHYESRTGSSMLVISQYDTKDQSTTLILSTSPKPSTSPSQHPTPPNKQDHYQDFSLIARDHPPSATPLTQSASNPLPPRDYQSPSTTQRNRTATSYTTHTSPSNLVSTTPPPKSSHNSDSSAVQYQSIAPITAVIPPPHTVDPKSHYMAVPDFSKFQIQKSESLGATPPVPARRTHAATVMTDRRVETVTSDSALYFPKAKVESTEPAFVAPPQRDEYQKIPSKEEMQSMIMQKRNAQNQSKPQPTPSSPPEENNQASNQNENAETEMVPPPPKQEDKVEAPHTTPEKPESTIMEGFLGKKGDVGVIKAWKRRWFVLRLDLLVYYKSQEDREQNLVIGFIPLCDASAVYPSSNAPTNTAFQIDTKERVWYLRADTRAEMEQWIDACKANCNIKELVTPVDEVQKRQSMVAIARNQTLMKEGDLEKLHGTVFKMRKVYVKSGILYKYINKPSKVTLFKCIIEDEVPEHGPLAFRVSTESKVFTFRASSDSDKEEWLELLMKHKLLTETIINPH